MDPQRFAGAYRQGRLYQQIAPWHRRKIIDHQITHDPARIVEQQIGQLDDAAVPQQHRAAVQQPGAQLWPGGDHIHARTLAHICFADAFTISIASGSPLISASRYAFACFIVMCGGNGGTLGSVTISSTTGRVATSARSHAGPTSSGRSTRSPSSPSNSA